MEMPDVTMPPAVQELPDVVAGQFDLSVKELSHALAYLGVGVVAGLLFKKYLKLVITSLIVAILILKGMEYRQIIMVDWVALKAVFGFEPAATLESVGSLLYDWLREQSLLAMSTLIGFIIGYKAG